MAEKPFAAFGKGHGGTANLRGVGVGAWYNIAIALFGRDEPCHARNEKPRPAGPFVKRAMGLEPTTLSLGS